MKKLFLIALLFQFPTLLLANWNDYLEPAGDICTKWRYETYSVQEKYLKIVDIMFKIREVSSQLHHDLHKVESGGDEIKITAIKHNLESVISLVSISEEAFLSFKEAIVNIQNDMIDHEYYRIMLISEKISNFNIPKDKKRTN